MERQAPPPMGAEEYASLVSEASDEDLARGMEENREMILEQVFQRMPERFRPDRAGDLNAVVEWRIRGRADGGHDRWQLVIANGACQCVRDGDAEPTVALTVGDVDFIKLITGNASGPMLFTIGRLKIKGDLLLAARIQSFFEMPRTRA